MARTNLATQTPTSSGITPAYTAANVDGFAILNSGKTVLTVKNGNAASINVTVQTPGSIDGLALPDKVIAVPAGGERDIGNLAPNVYNQTTGEIYVDFSAVASVTARAVEP